jgi:hypothetical protein
MTLLLLIFVWPILAILVAVLVQYVCPAESGGSAQ